MPPQSCAKTNCYSGLSIVEVRAPSAFAPPPFILWKAQHIPPGSNGKAVLMSVKSAQISGSSCAGLLKTSLGSAAPLINSN